MTYGFALSKSLTAHSKICTAFRRAATVGPTPLDGICRNRQSRIARNNFCWCLGFNASGATSNSARNSSVSAFVMSVPCYRGVYIGRRVQNTAPSASGNSVLYRTFQQAKNVDGHHQINLALNPERPSVEQEPV